ncbi:uncharacterized protein LOC106145044 isoform X2 [Ictidomys tridecemlineatus]
MEDERGTASSFNSFCPVRSDQAWADKRLREPSRSLLFYLPIKLLQDNTLIWHGHRGSKPVALNRIISAADNKQKRSQATAILQKKTINSEVSELFVLLDHQIWGIH